MPRIIIRIENLFIAAIAFWWIYRALSTPNLSPDFFLKDWYVVVLVWLSFDISMVGYLINKRLGAFLYNLVHNYVLALLLLIIGLFSEELNLFLLGIILASHVGIDRFLGYGLKYPSDFKHTHIQKL